MMGGEVGAESDPGVGSTFWFTIKLSRGQGPMPDISSAQAVATEVKQRSHHAGSRLLLVEDNEINREVALALLSRGTDLEVDVAEDGQAAVEMVRSTNYDLVLMDIQMPVMDGLQATRLIRAMDGKADMPILAMTANIFEKDRIASLKAGMNGFIAKPFEPNDLFSEIYKWLNERA